MLCGMSASSTNAPLHRPVRLGVAGLGVMGTRTLATAAAHPDYEVVLAADTDPGAARRLAAGHPGIRVVTPQELAGAEGLDALYIATPPAGHADLAVAALRAGTAVFCEKPLAVTPGDGRRMLAAAQESGLVTAVNFPLSDAPATLHVERELAAGAAGELRGVDVELTFPLWPRAWQASATWVGERAEGGFVREVFSHFAYLTDRLAGPLRTGAASLSHAAGPTASETGAQALLYAGDLPVHVTGRAGVSAPETYSWTLWGTERSYRLLDWSELYASEGGGPWTAVPAPQEERGGSRLTAFAQALRGEPHAPLADFASAQRVLEAVESFHLPQG
jgi:predicted dehydrogenase